MRFSEIKIIKEGYKEVKQKFISDNPEESEQDIHEYIEKFRDLVNRNQLQGNEKNIDYWGKQGFESFKEMVDFKSQQKSKTQAKRSKVKGESITLAENDKWLIVVPLDKDASCFHGKNTDWCTTKPNQNYFEEYFYDKKVTLIYFIRKEDLNKWAIAVNDDDHVEYFDKNDNDISSSKFIEQTGLNCDKFIDMALKSKVPSQKRNEYKELKKKIKDAIKGVQNDKHNYKIEDALIKLKDEDMFDDYMYRIGVSAKYKKEFQMAAVKQDGYTLRYIKNPDKDVQLAAVKHNGLTLQYIKNPDKDVQLAAVKKNDMAIHYIADPHPDVKKYVEENK